MNIFDHIREHQHDDMPEPAKPEPTNIRPGTPERVELYRRRLEMGLSLFNDADPKTYEEGLRGEMPVNKSRPPTTPSDRADPIKFHSSCRNGVPFI